MQVVKKKKTEPAYIISNQSFMNDMKLAVDTVAGASISTVSTIM